MRIYRLYNTYYVYIMYTCILCIHNVLIHDVYYFILQNCLYICNIYSLGIQINFTCIKLNDTGHETTDWFQIGKGVCQGCILSPCLFNLYEEYIMRNARLEESQAGIKIAGRNINNLRYADDTTLTTESEELKSLLMKVKEENEKVG